jgi:hypothetical protein
MGRKAKQTPPPLKRYRAVRCATLGTRWLDIVDEDGVLFAREVPRDMARAFVRDPFLCGSAFADVEMLRGRVIENFYRWLDSAPAAHQDRKRNRKKEVRNATAPAR